MRTRPSGRSYKKTHEKSGDPRGVTVPHRSLGVVHACDDGRVEDRDTRVDRLRRVVEKGLEIGVRSETEASNTLLSAVDDEEGTIR